MAGIPAWAAQNIWTLADYLHCCLLQGWVWCIGHFIHE